MYGPSVLPIVGCRGLSADRNRTTMADDYEGTISDLEQEVGGSRRSSVITTS